MRESARQSRQTTSCHINSSPWKLAFALALVLLTMSCARSPGSPQVYAIGQTVDVDGWQLTVHSFSEMRADQWRHPAPGHVFCVVEVTLENHSERIRFFMPEKQMTVVDEGANSYALDHAAGVIAAQAYGWLVPEGEMSVGEKAHGAAAYQIASQASGLRLIFRSDLLPWAPQVSFVLGDLPIRP
jgi:hypothetical protein